MKMFEAVPIATSVRAPIWPIYAACGLGCSVASAFGFALGVSPAEDWRLAARYTARSALPFFLLAFSASSLARLLPSSSTRYVLHRRRHVGLAFALAHGVHLVMIVISSLSSGTQPKLATVIGGGLAYGFIFAMAATSNAWAVRALGAKNWRRLHAIGAHYVWLIFAYSYFGRILRPDSAAVGVVGFGALVLALAIRITGKLWSPKAPV
jgi:methionine sulfoxide reductase heme-binding subunit